MNDQTGFLFLYSFFYFCNMFYRVFIASARL